MSCKNDLTSAFLNVDGLSDAKLDDVAFFVTAKSPDFFFFWKQCAVRKSLDQTSHVSGDKPGGGIAFYAKNTSELLFRNHTPDILHGDLEYVNTERFWVLVDSLQCKTAICGAYVACQYNDNRNYEWNIAFARGGAHLPIAHALRLLSTQDLRFGLTK